MEEREDIHPEFSRMLGRNDKERLLKQRGFVVWLYGKSGSGKSTLANALERRLHKEGYFTQLLDGDNNRTGLTRALGFSREDRKENLRRVAEVAKLFKESGVITLVSFITPLHAAREQVREIIGEMDLVLVYIRASFETCAQRDPKGLYEKGRKGELPHFTREGMLFEEPANRDLILDTDGETIESSLETLLELISDKIIRS